MALIPNFFRMNSNTLKDDIEKPYFCVIARVDRVNPWQSCILWYCFAGVCDDILVVKALFSALSKSWNKH